jgi:hypothetical protein
VTEQVVQVPGEPGPLLLDGQRLELLVGGREGAVALENAGEAEDGRRAVAMGRST